MIGVLELVIPGRPIPKGRPRRSANGGVFTPKRTTDEEDRIAWYAKSKRTRFPAGVELAIDLRFHVSAWRGDIDNLVKLALDGLEKGGTFANDRQITRLTAEIVRDDDERTEITVEER